MDIHTAIYDECERHENCTVEILRNSVTKQESIGWWENDKPPITTGKNEIVSKAKYWLNVVKMICEKQAFCSNCPFYDAKNGLCFTDTDSGELTYPAEWRVKE